MRFLVTSFKYCLKFLLRSYSILHVNRRPRSGNISWLTRAMHGPLSVNVQREVPPPVRLNPVASFCDMYVSLCWSFDSRTKTPSRRFDISRGRSTTCAVGLCTDNSYCCDVDIEDESVDSRQEDVTHISSQSDARNNAGAKACCLTRIYWREKVGHGRITQ